jgi:hypothetical protein
MKGGGAAAAGALPPGARGLGLMTVRSDSNAAKGSGVVML